MTLKNKIIAALTTLGIAAGTYTIGGLDLQCALAENKIDIRDVRLCVSDKQLAQIKADDFLSIVSGQVRSEDTPRIVELAKRDIAQYRRVSDELIDKIATNRNSQKLDQLNKSLALEKPEYLQSLKDSLIAKYKANRGIKLDDYNLHVFMLSQLLPETTTLEDFNPQNALEKLHSLIK